MNHKTNQKEKAMVRRIYVEKKKPYAVKAKELKADIISYLSVSDLKEVRELIRYDIENLSKETYDRAKTTVFAEPPVDMLYEEDFERNEDDRVFSVEFLPGQFDQRADSAEQCVKFLNEDENPVIRTAITYCLTGSMTDEQFTAIKNYCINPVDSRETGLKKPDTLITVYDEPKDIKVFDGFKDMEDDRLKELYDSLELAMTYKDFKHIQNYFLNDEKRDPTMTEIRVLDTYWSDHCRHTTFSTELKDIVFEEGDYRKPILDSYNKYIETRKDLYGDESEQKKKNRFICLMDLALLAMKKLKKDGKLQDMEESDEINACSIVLPVEIDGVREEWLISFKNETHNHPTEIEPFGGAATCLGGAIRDPLSGRSYVYQAMRITGAADPTLPLEATLKGKLPQKKLVRGAASGYSSYGNQIGLATGYVKEIYHPNYVAKRMEIGAVMGAAPRRDVMRLSSDPGNIIILLGGRTGRDGCGGATGSSKIHTESSIEKCGAEVQKGNAPTERKLQRLFRRPEVSRLIRKCNDFGAGGVSVAIGELADGLYIDLDKVPKKYAGLDGTELAISESQERMAVVVDKKDVEEFMKYAAEENLEAVEVAVVTEDPRLVLLWRGKKIVNLKREFLNTNGAHQETEVKVILPDKKEDFFNKYEIKGIEDCLKASDIKGAMLTTLKDLNVCSQKGLVEMFDSSIGAGSVLMPYGGQYQLTEIQTMIAKLPVKKGKCDTVTMMSYGFDPYLSSFSPYHGAVYAVLQSMAKIVAAGGRHKKIRFTFQEYFKRMTGEAERYSEPFLSLLGAFEAQLRFGLPSIGGKDSMSGTFNDIDVPPTLVSFAVDTADIKEVITPELKKAGNKLVILKVDRDENDLPDYDEFDRQYDKFEEDAGKGLIESAYVPDGSGIFAALSKMAFGNALGFKIEHNIDERDIFKPQYGLIIAEVKGENLGKLSIRYTLLGEVTDKGSFEYRDITLSEEDALKQWKKPLEKVFPTRSGDDTSKIDTDIYKEGKVYLCKNKIAKPGVFIPVFPGTNCEYDSAKAFERAGASVITKVFKNRDPQDIRDSVLEFKESIKRSQIIMFPGGFSAGDEPDGSAKFFATAFQNEAIKEAVWELLNKRDGLVLGICNGFQALIKLGLVPSGRITGQNEASPTLTYNTINRHVSKMVYTKVVSDRSPWLTEATVGNVYVIPASHGEGRFVADQEVLKELFEKGQVATQYCDPKGNISMDEEWNVNGSYMAIEGILSPDGRVFGKMGHSERRGDGVALNIYGDQDMKIFESGVKYFL
ncbi:MAG: phosphoribosylformylglycinamidine synthase [Lachnospiraceae bacterium]|nr:phosphoribosylformylglycinamidine synthase [Lachnospiraceae bacterium]